MERSHPPPITCPYRPSIKAGARQSIHSSARRAMGRLSPARLPLLPAVATPPAQHMARVSRTQPHTPPPDRSISAVGANRPITAEWSSSQLRGGRTCLGLSRHLPAATQDSCATSHATGHATAHVTAHVTVHVTVHVTAHVAVHVTTHVTVQLGSEGPRAARFARAAASAHLHSPLTSPISPRISTHLRDAPQTPSGSPHP